MRRKGELPGRSGFRTVRFVLTNGAWYFATREGIDIGPFNSRHSAVRACDRLVDQLSRSGGTNARKIVENFVTFQMRREDRAMP